MNPHLSQSNNLTLAITNRNVFVFEFDNVLYPEKDYLLQVYYLFAQFMEYNEQVAGGPIITYMQDVYQQEGAAAVFDRVSAKFHIDKKYKANFDLLMQTAKLPLKLLLFAPILELLRTLAASGKTVFLLVDGDPVIALNKIKQLEWNEMDTLLKVYFTVELNTNSTIGAIKEVLLPNEMNAEDLVWFGNADAIDSAAVGQGIKYFSIAKLLSLEKRI